VILTNLHFLENDGSSHFLFVSVITTIFVFKVLKALVKKPVKLLFTKSNVTHKSISKKQSNLSRHKMAIIDNFAIRVSQLSAHKV